MMTSKTRTRRHSAPGYLNSNSCPPLVTKASKAPNVLPQPINDETYLKNLKVSYQSVKFLFPKCQVKLSLDAEWKCKEKQSHKQDTCRASPLLVPKTVAAKVEGLQKQEVVNTTHIKNTYVNDRGSGRDAHAGDIEVHSTWEDKFVEIEWENDDTYENEQYYKMIENQPNISVSEILVLKPKWLQKDCKKVIFRDFHVSLTEIGIGNRSQSCEIKRRKVKKDQMSQVVSPSFEGLGKIEDGKLGDAKQCRFHDYVVKTETLKEENLSVKVENNLKGRQYYCELCTNSFNKKSKLFNHMLTHTGEKPYQCRTCRKRFRLYQNLWRHARIHSSERPFHCKTCGQRFKRSCHLKRHARIHSSERPFQCQTCGQSFKRSCYLKRHLIKDHTTKSYDCKFCDENFSREYKLKVHCGLVHNTKLSPYRCGFCQHPFSMTSSLNRHVKLGRCKGSRGKLEP